MLDCIIIKSSNCPMAFKDLIVIVNCYLNNLSERLNTLEIETIHLLTRPAKMSSKNDTIDILATNSIKASITDDDVNKILLDYYGLRVTKIKVLNGYDDLNFLVNVEKSAKNDFISEVCEFGYVLKIINSFDSKSLEFFNAQDCVLLFLGNKNICCPKPVKTVDGKFLKLKKFSSGEHIFRVLEFLPGDILVDVKCSPMLCYECGAFIANLNETLKNFSHKGYENRNVIWMMEDVPQLLQFLFAVKDPKKEQMVREIVDAFQSRVIASSHRFPKGLIHGDFNEQNILVERREGEDWHVKGVLDFGDSHITCFLYDIAITMTYIIFHTKDLDCGGYVLAGYQSTKPLSSEEIQLLKVCVCARMCQSLVLGAFTYSRDPGNTYVIRTSKFGWEILDKLWHTPEETIIGSWRSICDSFTPINT